MHVARDYGLSALSHNVDNELLYLSIVVLVCDFTTKFGFPADQLMSFAGSLTTKLISDTIMVTGRLPSYECDGW